MMTKEAKFRPAKPDEAELLGEIIMEGLYSYGYDEIFPKLMQHFRDTNLPSPKYIQEEPVVVLEENDEVVGFYGMKKEDEYIDLLYLFMREKFIGKGYGKKLWYEAIEHAKSLKFDSMRIGSDPGAMWFYEAMSAEKEKEYTVMEGFNLGIYWFKLND